MNKSRKAEIKNLSPAQVVSARNTYVTNQFNRLQTSMDSGYKPKMKIIAEHGYTNFLDITWGEVEAIKAVLTAAEAQDDSRAIEPDVGDVTVRTTPDGDLIVIEWEQTVIKLTLCAVSPSKGFEEPPSYLYTISVTDSDCVPLDPDFHAHQDLIKRIIREAIPAEHCQHAHDCCGRAYRNSPNFLFSQWHDGSSTLSMVHLTYTRNV